MVADLECARFLGSSYNGESHVGGLRMTPSPFTVRSPDGTTRAVTFAAFDCLAEPSVVSAGPSRTLTIYRSSPRLKYYVDVNSAISHSTYLLPSEAEPV